MSSMRYVDLIGKHVTVIYHERRRQTEYKGVIEEASGIYFLLVQDDGTRIWLPKIRKHDCMILDKEGSL